MEILQGQSRHTLQQIIHGVDAGQCSHKALDMFLGGSWVVLTRLLGPAPSGEWFCHGHGEERDQLALSEGECGSARPSYFNAWLNTWFS